jgi:hypothetical protein
MVAADPRFPFWPVQGKGDVGHRFYCAVRRQRAAGKVLGGSGLFATGLSALIEPRGQPTVGIGWKSKSAFRFSRRDLEGFRVPYRSALSARGTASANAIGRGTSRGAGRRGAGHEDGYGDMVPEVAGWRGPRAAADVALGSLASSRPCADDYRTPDAVGVGVGGQITLVGTERLSVVVPSPSCPWAP